MCRLLFVNADREFDIPEYLERFAFTARNSPEYQGHGWGCAYVEDGTWKHFKNIQPIWNTDLRQFGKTRLLLAHARSAFRNEGITVENNMPFYDDKYVFIFNGELRGVRISEEGRIGAEKLFNFIKRFDRGNMAEAFKRGTDLLQVRSKYIRAMNIMIADMANVYVASYFNEQPDYFTMHRCNGLHRLIIASDPLPGDDAWEPVGRNTVQVHSIL
jgi:glutamine amidotransferase